MNLGALRERLRVIIFEADTTAGRNFDVWLIGAILLSVVTAILASVHDYYDNWRLGFLTLEWLFTIAFTIEYLLRLWIVRAPWRYATSFYGIVDLAAILPTYLSIFFHGAEYLIVIRLLRTLRVFRILKLVKYMESSQVLVRALRASRPKITVFLFAVLALVTIIGSLMYLIEGEEHGFVNIPESIYWAVVTLTTVGYGDISPETALGRFLATVVMVMGYGIIAVPTGIVTAELSRVGVGANTRSCPHCAAEGHHDRAKFCDLCGADLNPPNTP